MTPERMKEAIQALIQLLLHIDASLTPQRLSPQTEFENSSCSEVLSHLLFLLLEIPKLAHEPTTIGKGNQWLRFVQ